MIQKTDESVWNTFVTSLNPETQIDVLLHPTDEYGKQKPVSSVYTVLRPALEITTSSFLLQFKDEKTGEIIVGKILRPIKDNVRDHSTRKKRHTVQKQTQRNIEFAPDGLCIGLRPILHSKFANVFSFGDIVKTHEPLDRNLEYVWFMHHLAKGESLDKKLIRNRSLIRYLPQTIIDIQKKSGLLTATEAVKKNSFEFLQESVEKEYGSFVKAITIMQETHPELLENLWNSGHNEQLKKTLDACTRNQKLSQMLLKRAEQGFVKKIHGDLKTSNLWYSDFYRKNPIEYDKDCIIPIDAIDFSDTIATGDLLSEGIFIGVDIQARLPVEYFNYFMRIYLKESGLLAEDGSILSSYSLLYQYYKLQKAIVHMLTTVLHYQNNSLAKEYLSIVKKTMELLGDALKRKYN